MELIVFDLDGTLIDRTSAISDYTRETLERLSARSVAYTVATGRTLHGSRAVLHGHRFDLPHVYKNGVLIWHPRDEAYSHQNLLTTREVERVVTAIAAQGLTPFVFTLENASRQAVYHRPPRSDVERDLAAGFEGGREVSVAPAASLPAGAEITHVSSVGEPRAIDAVSAMVADEPCLVAYAGMAIEGAGLKWTDIHHSDASKGAAVDILVGDPRIADALEKVVAACREHGKHPGLGGVYDPALMQRYVELGMRFILCGNDIAMLITAAKERASMMRALAV